MNTRLEITKTYKLYINGAFPRSESGRSLKVFSPDGAVAAHLCHASRKDLRDAVSAARNAADPWAARAAYNRGQILYRMAEMLEGKKPEFIAALADALRAAPASTDPPTATTPARKPAARKATTPTPATARRSAQREVETAIDRLIAFAGWADKYQQVLGCNNPVAGPYYNFTIPQPTGVVAVVAPDQPALLALISLTAPVLCAGCTVVALGSEAAPLPTSLFAEVCHTSDLPPGVVNLLTGRREELMKWFAEHRAIDAIHAANLPDEHAHTLRSGAAENVKRIRVRDIPIDTWLDPDFCENPWMIEPFVDMKTIWHPSAV